MYSLQNHISHKNFGAQFLLQVFVFSRISRQDETKHNKPQRQYFVCFSLSLPPVVVVGTFAEYPLLHFSQQCFQSRYGKQHRKYS